ncbi:hypothetical protein H0H92_002121 [Tricholoma furcatifolium]|nr:hypothetical protein H0H92_002121 [Tricholoma furcatifolium]
MPRRKPTSTRQKKADIQLKRAIKRGDAPPPDPQAKPRKPKFRRGPTGAPLGSATDPAHAASIHAARKLQSAFVKLPPNFLEETKALATKLPLHRPLLDTAAIYAQTSRNTLDSKVPSVSCPRRPKWRFDMTKKEVESNEEGLFRKWLDQMDGLVLDWQNKSCLEVDQQQSPGSQTDVLKEPDAMPRSPTYFERNLEVWRQLWRVSEISQILLVLLDSRCPLLHFPPSLASYLSDRKIILVLTKVDISGPERVSAWTTYFQKEHPHLRVVQVESYAIKEERAMHQGRAQYEPHLPPSFREQLVAAIRSIHAEMLIPPEKIRNNPKAFSHWKPAVKTDIDWDRVLKSDVKVANAFDSKAGNEGVDNNDDQEEVKEPEFLTIGLIGTGLQSLYKLKIDVIVGQPNVGKSSLLNALFGVNRVRASKTPGKTKHFQTLFWTPDIRFVDCPGLVMPNLVPMEMQVLCGILPISRVSAISSSIHFASERLPLERVYGLEHPSLSAPPVIDKRTWREGMRPESVENKPIVWTAMDVLVAYANLKKWVTAKAGRPDTHRAGNAILRALAEGRIAWAFWPPGTDPKTIAANVDERGTGIWIPGGSASVEDDTESDDDTSGETSDEDEKSTDTAESEEIVDEEDSDSDSVSVAKAPISRFGALEIEDIDEEEE